MMVNSKEFKAKEIFNRLTGLENRVASREDLKKTYRELAMRYHPDLGGLQSDMQDLNWANDVLESHLTDSLPVRSFRERGAAAMNESRDKRRILDSHIKAFEDLLHKSRQGLTTYLQERVLGVEFSYIISSAGEDSATACIEWMSVDPTVIIRFKIKLLFPDNDDCSKTPRSEHELEILCDGHAYRRSDKRNLDGLLASGLIDAEEYFPMECFEKCLSAHREHSIRCRV